MPVKPIVEGAIEGLSKLGKFTKQADEAAEAVLQAEKEAARSAAQASALDAFEADMRQSAVQSIDEFNNFNKQVEPPEGFLKDIDESNQYQKLIEERDARVQLLRDKFQQEERTKALYDPGQKLARNSWQTRNADEAGRRLQEQLMNPEYSASRVYMGRTDAESLGEAIDEWGTASTSLTPALQSDYMAPIRQFTEGTILTRGRMFGDTDPTTADLPAVLYHIDTMPDPEIAAKGSIQGSLSANEFGIHAGSTGAANQFLDNVMAPLYQSETYRTAVKEFDEATGGAYFLGERMNEVVERGIRSTFQRPGVGPDAELGDLRREFAEELTKAIKADVASFQKAARKARLTVDDEAAQLSDLGLVTDPALYNINSQSESFATSAGMLHHDMAHNISDRAGILANRIVQSMSRTFAPSGFPLVANSKNPLVMDDIGNWEAQHIARKLLENAFFKDDATKDQLLSIQNLTFGQDVEANLKLAELLEGKGFDSIAYHNNGEDKGVLSFLFWKRDSWTSLYHPEVRMGRRAGREAQIAEAKGELGTPPDNVTELVQPKEYTWIAENNLEQVEAISQRAIPRFMRTLNDPKASDFAKEQAREKLQELAGDMRKWGERAIKSGATPEMVADAQKGILPAKIPPLTEADVMAKANAPKAEVVGINGEPLEIQKVDPANPYGLEEAEKFAKTKGKRMERGENWVNVPVSGGHLGEVKTKLLKNPSASEITKWAKKNDYHSFRVFRSEDGNLFVWHAYSEALHSDMAKYLGYEGKITNMDYDDNAGIQDIKDIIAGDWYGNEWALGVPQPGEPGYKPKN